MFTVFLLAFLFILAVIFGAVKFTPDELSVSELERRAKRSKSYAVRLRRQNALAGLATLLQSMVWVFLVLFIVTAAVQYGWFVGFLVSMFAIAVLPALSRIGFITRMSTRLYMTQETRLLHLAERFPAVWRFFSLQSFGSIASPPKIASKEELIEVLSSAGAVLTKDERQLFESGLAFGDKKVGQIMTPRTVIQTVQVGDFLGPLVLDELHKKGHARLPVIAEDIDHVVGVINLQNLLSLDVRKSQTAEELMEKRVFYIHQDDSLQKALNEFIKRRHHLFIVVNTQRETVGLLTLEDVLEALIGRQIVDEDDVHGNMRDWALEKGADNNNAPTGTYL